jgi:hypothetical protein
MRNRACTLATPDIYRWVATPGTTSICSVGQQCRAHARATDKPFHARYRETETVVSASLATDRSSSARVSKHQSMRMQPMLPWVGTLTPDHSTRA